MLVRDGAFYGVANFSCFVSDIGRCEENHAALLCAIVAPFDLIKIGYWGIRNIWHWGLLGHKAACILAKESCEVLKPKRLFLEVTLFFL